MLFASLVAAAVALPAATYPALPMTARDPKCPERPTAFHAVGDDIPQACRLDREPPASLFLSVYREVGGCTMPVVLRSGDRR